MPGYSQGDFSVVLRPFENINQYGTNYLRHSRLSGGDILVKQLGDNSALNGSNYLQSCSFPEQGYRFGGLFIGVERYLATFQSVFLDCLIAI